MMGSDSLLDGATAVSLVGSGVDVAVAKTVGSIRADAIA